MKSAYQVLALRRIDPGFAPDRAVDLSKQAGWNLNKPDTAAQDGGSKPHEIANNAAPKSHDHIPTLDFLFQEPFDCP